MTAPALWPFQPLVGTQENLEFLTDVLGAYTGEQRIAIRAAPRQSLGYTFQIRSSKYSTIRALAQQYSGAIIGVPVWPEAKRLGTGLASGSTSISIDTTNGDYRGSSYAMAWDDDESYEVLSVASVSAGALTLTGSTVATYDNPVIAPVRLAYFPGGVTFDRGAVFAQVRATFQATDNVLLTGGSPYPQFCGLDVITDKPSFISNLSETILNSSDYVDNGAGPIVPVAIRNYLTYAQTLSYDLKTRAAVWSFRNWLHTLNGKQKSFWLPSFKPDLQITSSIGSSDVLIHVKHIGPTSYYAGKRVYLETHDGTKYYRTISGATVISPTVDQITINASLGHTVTVSDICKFSFMSKVRLDSDSVLIDHRFSNRAVVSIPVMEIPA